MSLESLREWYAAHPGGKAAQRRFALAVRRADERKGIHEIHAEERTGCDFYPNRFSDQGFPNEGWRVSGLELVREARR